MGKSDDANAVLDSRLRVRGVRNLRVADVSSIPKVNNGHTQMVAYGIGEGAAEMIKEDAADGEYMASRAMTSRLRIPVSTNGGSTRYSSSQYNHDCIA